MNSVIGWVGGKRLLRKAIVPLIPKHDTHGECEARIHYVGKTCSLNLPDSWSGLTPTGVRHNCEPFAGAAWILFAKSRDHKEWQATKGQKYRGKSWTS